MQEQAQDQQANNIADKSVKAIDMLYEAMLFWRSEGNLLIKELKRLLDSTGEGKLAAKVAMVWKDVDDRWIDIAAKLAPYQSAKLSSVEVKGTTIVKHVVRVQTRAKDHKEWLERVEEDKKYLPKPQIIDQTDNSFDDTIDDAEFEEINEGNR